MCAEQRHGRSQHGGNGIGRRGGQTYRLPIDIVYDNGCAGGGGGRQDNRHARGVRWGKYQRAIRGRRHEELAFSFALSFAFSFAFPFSFS
jgi:hypothetical protein